MLLQNELTPMTQRIKALKIDDLQLLEYAKKVEKSGHYNCLCTRIVNDIKYCISPSIICDLYDKYNCNDTHITTLFKAITKELYPVTYEYITNK